MAVSPIVSLEHAKLSLCAVAAPGISAHPSEDNLRYFNVMILGPQQSPYEGAHLLRALLPGFFLQLVLLRQGCGIAHTVLAGLVKAACVCTGGVFKLELFLPEDYPMAAPKVGAPLWIGLPALRR